MTTVILIIAGLIFIGWIGEKLEIAKSKDNLPEKAKTVKNTAYLEPEIEVISNDFKPVKKVFSATPSLNTPLEILKLHGLSVAIDDHHYDDLIVSRSFGYWENIYPDEILALTIKNRISRDDLEIEMLIKVREIYESNQIEAEKAWDMIKNICSTNRFKYASERLLGADYIANYFYPSVLSLAIGIKQNQIEALSKFNICTIRQLEACTDKDLLSLPGIGKKTLIALRMLQKEDIPKDKKRLPRNKEMWDGSVFLLEYYEE